MRVGTPALDNAHGENRMSAINTETLPLDDDPQANCTCSLAAEPFTELPQGFYRVSLNRADEVHRVKAKEGRPVGRLQQGSGADPRGL